MSHVSQAVDTRLWTGAGAEPLRISEGLGEASPLRAVAPDAERRLAAQPAHNSLMFVAMALAALGIAGFLIFALTNRAEPARQNRADSEVIHIQELAARLSDARAQLAATTRDLSKANEQLAARTSQLQRSEADVARLEIRLQALGTEKARVEDEREAVRDHRDRLVEIASLATRLNQDVDSCVSGLSNWLASRPSPLNVTQPAPWATWASSGDSVAASCANARVSNDQLETAIKG